MSGPERRSVHPIVQVLVVAHIVAITLWSLPRTPIYPRGTDALLRLNDEHFRPSPARYYLEATGVWQYWDMFAPDPSRWDGYVDAEVTYQSGEKRIYAYPRMKKLGIVEKYFKERYRKFLERAHLEQYQYLWPTFAQRIALEATTDPANPVVAVTLRRHWRMVQPPEKPQPTEYSRYDYFTHVVDLEKLRRDLRS